MKVKDFLSCNVHTGVIITNDVDRDPHEHHCIGDSLYEGFSTRIPKEFLDLEISYVTVDYDEKRLLIEVKLS